MTPQGQAILWMIGQLEPYVNAFHLLSQAQTRVGCARNRGTMQRDERTKPASAGAAGRAFPATVGGHGTAIAV